MPKSKVTIELEGSPMQIAAQKKIIEKLVKLPSDHRTKISEIIDNPKALPKLAENWEFLKSFLQ